MVAFHKPMQYETIPINKEAHAADINAGDGLQLNASFFFSMLEINGAFTGFLSFEN
jgi:hypothetical protein